MSQNVPENLEEQLRQLIASVIVRSPDELKTETNFFKDLGVDSIKAIEITVSLERNFKISIRDEQIPQIETFGQAVELVRKALEKKNS